MVAKMGPKGPDTEAPEKLIYREDEGHFKRRLDSSVQFYWVYNTAMTVLVCVLVFYFLGQPLFISIIVALLILLVSNIQMTLSRVGQATRWKVSTNSVTVPSGRRGRPQVVQFSDISSIERGRSVLGARVVLHMKDGCKLTFPLGGQERPLNALVNAFSKYAAVKGHHSDRTEVPGSRPLLLNEDPGHLP